MSSVKVPAPVGGFNHNVKYGPRVYHVQTEDSGLPRAHYITHLFVGGNIVSSVKSSYAEKAADGDLAKAVRALMEAQHKLMLRRLISGEFNDLAERLSANHYEPGVLATGEHSPGAVNTAPAAPAPASALRGSAVATPASASARAGPPAPAVARPAAPPPARLVTPAAAPPLKPAAPPPPRLPAPVASPAPLPLPQAPTQRPAALQTPARVPAPLPPGVWQPAPPGASTPPSPRFPGAPLPSTTRVSPQPGARPAPPRLMPIAAPALPKPPSNPVHRVPPPPRPAPALPPKLFAEEPLEVPHDDLPTLFAEELISEKSLDEVILAFLSADLEPLK